MLAEDLDLPVLASMDSEKVVRHLRTTGWWGMSEGKDSKATSARGGHIREWVVDIHARY